jgi:hypothetical protein
MKFKNIPLVALLVVFLVSGASAQRTEITISFNEQFFEALLDAIFQYAEPPRIVLAKNGTEVETLSQVNYSRSASSFAPSNSPAKCDESIKLLRESNGVRTAVRFREGKIVAPLAFTGNYNPPLIGCVPFSGTAETLIDLEFDQAGQRLIAKARVRDVSLNGTLGIGGSIVGRMVQGSIDKKINPIEIIRTDRVSFLLPLQNANAVRMKATGFSHDVTGGQLNVRVAYEFQKAN